MFYITHPINPATKQISIEDILAGEITDLRKYQHFGKWTSTRTDYVSSFKITKIPELRLKKFVEKYGSIIKEDMSEYYSEFKIPKAHGGFRTIDNPCAQLREAHNELKSIIEDNMLATYHTAAFAYVKNRCAHDAVKKHQINNSNWCLRTDFSNFFGSITYDFLLKMMRVQYPWCCLREESLEWFKQALKICFLHGGLPQGSTISPMLTNIIMIPIDYTIFKELTARNFVYTRYADDIQVSAYSKFDYREIVSYIDGVLKTFDAPFRIKPEKTKFSSVAGVNYMLGLNLNKEHKITVGWERKKLFKAMVFNFLSDYKNNKRWSRESVQHLQGVHAYYRSIEPEYTDYMIKHIEEKTGLDLKQTMKMSL